MNDDDTQFWNLVANRGIPKWRWFRSSTSVDEIERELSGWSEWELLKQQIRDGDEIWPFQLRVREYLGDRSGYVVLRGGRPIGGVVVISS